MLKKAKEKKNFSITIKDKKMFFSSKKSIKSMLFSMPIGIILIAIATLFSGCSSAKKPYQLTMMYQAVEHLNPDIEGKAAPLVVILYQLKSPTKFQEAEFFSLYTDSTKVLGKNLLDKREIEIQPNQNITEVQNLCSETAYLGVVAGYRDITNAKWKSIFKVSGEKSITMKLVLGMLGIDLDSNGS